MVEVVRVVSFPSPRTLRRILAYPLDVLAHLAVAVTITLGTDPSNRHAITHQLWLDLDWASMIGLFLLVSFTDRVLLQALTHTTPAKAIFGLVIIDRDTGHYPRPRRLLTTWLLSNVLAIQIPLSTLIFGNRIDPDRIERHLLPAVRRRDIEPIRARQPCGDNTIPSEG
ncbi:RDD family protein [Nocardia sp. NPDC059177]|uniref:RDD family protein n=1 Tax=Nocardia sp. NPDC059177 TaxID=3346759 RepID=UPI00368D5DE4